MNHCLSRSRFLQSLSLDVSLEIFLHICTYFSSLTTEEE